MRVLLVLAIVVGLSAGDRCYRECARKKGRVRLDSQEVRINHLTAKIQGLEDEFDHKIDEGHHDRDVLVALDLRLRELDHEGCGDHQFYCGGNTNECVDNLQVCDGEKDCKNGHDEDDHTCSSPVHSGDKWIGTPLWDDCTQRRPYELSVVVSDTERPAWYPGRMNVHAAIITRSKDRHTTSTSNLATDGYYDYATRRLILLPPESDQLGMIMDFNTGDPKDANGYIVREATLERCGLFVLHRDEHH